MRNLKRLSGRCSFTLMHQFSCLPWTCRGMRTAGGGLTEEVKSCLRLRPLSPCDSTVRTDSRTHMEERSVERSSVNRRPDDYSQLERVE